MAPDASWRATQLGDIVTIQHGWAFKSEFFHEELTGGPVVVGVGNFQYTGGFRFDSTRLKEYGGDYPTEYELRPGDILLVMTGQTSGGEILGIPGRIPADGRLYLHNQRLGKVVVTNPQEIDLGYLYWLFLSPDFNRHLFVTASGSKILHTSPTRIQDFRFALPRRDEQAAIASVLGSLDDKIEANRRMNRTLEATARTLFRSWFVDFDPVRAKADGHAPAGLDAATAALFPDRFEASALGNIPAGWRVSSLGDHVEVAKGLSYKGAGLADAGVPMHNLNSVYEGGGYKHEGLKRYTGEYKERHLVRPGDLIVANTEQGHDLLLIGYPAIVPACYGESGLFTHHIYRVRTHPGSPVTNHFLFHLLRTPSMHDEVGGYTNGTTVNMLAADGLLRPLFVTPPEPVLGAFQAFAVSLAAQSDVLHEESRTLAALRDGLLPRLVSGQLRVV